MLYVPLAYTVISNYLCYTLTWNAHYAAGILRGKLEH